MDQRELIIQISLQNGLGVFILCLNHFARVFGGQIFICLLRFVEDFKISWKNVIL